MKKAKVVVNQAVKKNRLTLGKKAALSALGLVATLGVVSVVVPTSNIPGFSYIATAIGLNADATRNLTMADFASYALGTKDNKIQELRASNLSYNGVGNYGGGLSPFATFSSDRLAEAYEKNAQEAREMEKKLGGQITPFNKNAINREIVFDKNLLAKGFDPSKLSANSYAASSGAMEALAAAAGQQAEAFGKPIQKIDLKDIAGAVNLQESNISNIVGGGNIASIARKDNSLYEKMMQAARAITGTSVFGIANADLNRTDTRIGRPVYGLFKDLGNSYFFSRYAVGAKLPTAASDIAAAAFDGGTPQNQSLITNEDAIIVGGSTNPMLALNQSAQQVEKCQQMKETFKQTIANSYNEVERIRLYMENLYPSEDTKTPGICYGKNENAYVKQARDDWNNAIYDLVAECRTLTQQKRKFASQCGIIFEEPIKDCQEMEYNLRLAQFKEPFQMIRKCRRMAVFDKSGYFTPTAKGKQKLKKLDNLYKQYRNEYIEQGFDAETASQMAALKADSEITIDKNDLDVDFYCINQADCHGHLEEEIEASFAFGRILDITSLPKARKR